MKSAVNFAMISMGGADKSVHCTILFSALSLSIALPIENHCKSAFDNILLYDIDILFKNF